MQSMKLMTIKDIISSKKEEPYGLDFFFHFKKKLEHYYNKEENYSIKLLKCKKTRGTYMIENLNNQNMTYEPEAVWIGQIYKVTNEGFLIALQDYNTHFICEGCKTQKAAENYMKDKLILFSKGISGDYIAEVKRVIWMKAKETPAEVINRAGNSDIAIHNENPYKLYTDGGCLKNPDGPGGYGVIIIAPDGKIEELKGGNPSSTNNRMEIIAAIVGLSHIPTGQAVKVYSDSQYVIKTMNGEFKKKKNLDLWEKLDEVASHQAHIEWNWVKGHNGNLYNERCDKLATEGMEKYI